MAPLCILLWFPWKKSTPRTTQPLKVLLLKMEVDLLTCESYEMVFFTFLFQNTIMWESVTTRLSFTLIVTPKLGLVRISDSSSMSSSSLFMVSILESMLSQFPTVWELTKCSSELLDCFYSSPHWNCNGLASGLGFRFVFNLIPGIWNPSLSWALYMGRNLPGLYSFSSTKLWNWSLVGAVPFLSRNCFT